MISRPEMQKSIKEIYELYLQRNVISAFTLESVQTILEIGNEVFQKNNPEEVEKIRKHPPSQAPDILDDEPFSLARTLEIYKRLKDQYQEISPELIQRVFETNSRLAWESYRKKYNEYILSIYKDHPADEYINYLAAIVFYDKKEYGEALKCINMSLAENPSSANYTHIKGLCLMQAGELSAARTYLYQALFLIELRHDIPPRTLAEERSIYPNYPIEFQTSVDLIRTDLRKLDKIDDIFNYEFMPLIE